MQLHHEARRLKLAIEAAWLDPHGQEIKLPCNFGRHKAMLIGPSEAKGDLGFPLDGDLEVEPEWLAPREEALRRTTTPIAGSHTVRLGRTDDEHARQMEERNEARDRRSRRGFAFNCLTLYSDPAGNSTTCTIRIRAPTSIDARPATLRTWACSETTGSSPSRSRCGGA